MLGDARRRAAARAGGHLTVRVAPRRRRRSAGWGPGGRGRAARARSRTASRSSAPRPRRARADRRPGRARRAAAGRRPAAHDLAQAASEALAAGRPDRAARAGAGATTAARTCSRRPTGVAAARRQRSVSCSATASRCCGVVVLAYFAVLNLIYLAAHRGGLARDRAPPHARAYAGVEEVLASPLTPASPCCCRPTTSRPAWSRACDSLLGAALPEDRGDRRQRRLHGRHAGAPARGVRPAAGAGRPAPEVPHAEVLGTYVSARHPTWSWSTRSTAARPTRSTAASAPHATPRLRGRRDAILEEDALLRVVEPIVDDPDLVVASGGIVRIANGCRVEDGKVVEVRLPRSRLATLQVVEYLRAFLVGRMGWNRLDALLIISGAFGVFRRSVVGGRRRLLDAHGRRGHGAGGPHAPPPAGPRRGVPRGLRARPGLLDRGARDLRTLGPPAPALAARPRPSRSGATGG